VALAVLLIGITILLLGKVLRKVFPIVGFSIIVLLSVIIIQGLFNAENKTVFFHLGNIVFYEEGLSFASAICIRVISILCAFSILVLTTKPSDLIESLVRRGLSPKLGYVLGSVLQIIPEMMGTMETITDAQRSRGMETEGNLFVRIKAFIPLMGPLVMNSLVSTRERSMALEVRAFNSRAKKTFINEEQKTGLNKIIKILLFILLLTSILWRLA
jgi:energy-coupling factor transport system permease protein